MQMKWTSAALTHPGLRRKENQDALVFSPDNLLFSVSDGMGGVTYGKKTAMIISTMMTALAQRLRGWEEDSGTLAQELGRSISSISDNIQMLGNPEGKRPAFGATLTGFLLHGEDAIIFNVGDSRVYRLRQGELKAMTVDHSVVQILVESGEITAEEARNYPGRSTVTRFMGMHPTVVTDVKVVSVEAGDVFLVCSDGLHSMLPDADIKAILEQPLPLEETCARLVDAANQAGGEDNISVVVWRSEAVEAPAQDAGAEAKPDQGSCEDDANG